MTWLRWRWRCWRARHFAWQAYVQWYEEPSEINHSLWVRKRKRYEDTVAQGG